MKKVLIYADKANLRPVGGSMGYLYNLNIGLTQLKNKNIHFLNEDNIKNETFQTKQNIKKIIPSKIREKIHLFKFLIDTLYRNEKDTAVDFNKYDAIHFHTTTDLYRNRKKIKNYHGKVILTSHTPEAPYLETLDTLREAKIPFLNFWRRKLKEIDIYSFEKADNLIFPCKEAMEPYLHTMKYFKRNCQPLLSKTFFMVTGIQTKKLIKPKNLPLLNKKDFVVTYIGRHNQVKGYDLLLKAAKKISKIDPTIEFVIAGKEGPCYPDDNLKNWHELGWSNNPMGIEASSDLFVLPNRETYFDLALIEALSVPTVVLISKTGGNKYFEKFKSNSINFFNPNDVDDLVNQILYIRNNLDISQVKIQNKAIYENNFTPRIFAKNYIETIKQIIKG